MTDIALSDVCFICGKTNDVVVRQVDRTYTPNWVWLLLPVGILPAALVGVLLQVKHELRLPVCRPCSQRRSVARIISWLSTIVCIFLIFVAIGVAAGLESWLVFLGVTGLIVLVAYLAGRYDKKVNPRYTQFTKEQVEIDVPGRGRVVVFDLAGSRPGNISKETR